MEHLIIPEGYEPALNLHDTQIAIKTVKDFFQDLLAKQLNLLRVSAPLFVDPASGLNDNLNGVERPVSFDIKEQMRFLTLRLYTLSQSGTLCFKGIWLLKWRRSLHRYERKFAVMRLQTTSTPSLLTSGTGKKSSQKKTAHSIL